MEGVVFDLGSVGGKVRSEWVTYNSRMLKLTDVRVMGFRRCGSNVRSEWSRINELQGFFEAKGLEIYPYSSHGFGDP